MVTIAAVMDEGGQKKRAINPPGWPGVLRLRRPWAGSLAGAAGTYLGSQNLRIPLVLSGPTRSSSRPRLLATVHRRGSLLLADAQYNGSVQHAVADDAVLHRRGQCFCCARHCLSMCRRAPRLGPAANPWSQHTDASGWPRETSTANHQHLRQHTAASATGEEL